ncbi:helix-turn-helix domain-containing protein [Asticcacaulis sp. EMRT-3]|uniref:winged helix-turn-helix transcriptional regulator n=1 Tax=Asticcacaulis sp. EMRT-3 TaxID=3040349 RepID=UPI0024AEB947|nr:helix-turn-helix domain-containing protein [Asticcacaulis sp. EMRT-3]MDI7774507.1 helix-turn-helix domain-containing protein [Asticcacaulis sp. EMRT-3]
MKKPAPVGGKSSKTASRAKKPSLPTQARVKAAKPEPVKTHRSLCPVNLTLERIGDSWSMLIVRDLMLRGHNSYQGFLRSEEKIATNILADRLMRLEQNGLISKAADPSDKRKFIYALTARGADLAPILVEMALYAMKYEAIVHMPKEIVAEMQKNRQVYAQKLARSFTPKVAKARPADKPVAAKQAVQDFKPDFSDETLSLF